MAHGAPQFSLDPNIDILCSTYQILSECFYTQTSTLCPPINHIYTIYPFLGHRIVRGPQVLFHCQAGVNRSATLALAIWCVREQRPLLQVLRQGWLGGRGSPGFEGPFPPGKLHLVPSPPRFNTPRTIDPIV